MLSRRNATAALVRTSYDRIAPQYDHAWTGHMRGLSENMLGNLPPAPAPRRCLDLACGTGFVTSWLARRFGCEVVGVDASAGMLEQARVNCPTARFVQADAAQFVRSHATQSFDVITCAWALGYTRPLTVVRNAARMLRPGGRLAIIDNSLFSLAEVMRTSLATFAENPDALAHAMRVRFLPHVLALTALMRLAGLAVTWRASGSRTFLAADGSAAIERLRATGAAAGFEFAAGAGAADEVFRRFAQLLDRRYRGPVPITHRYLAAIALKE